MELSVAAALKQVGEPFRLDLTEPIEALSFGGGEIEFAAPLRLSGTYVFNGKEFTVAATADTVLRANCARCAVSFDEPYTFSVSERFVKASEADPDENPYAYLGDRIDLTKAVLDNLFLQLPLVSLCRPDCKGLCPVCGQDRNTTTCGCQPTEAGGPFTVLSALEEEE
ncbi:MAG: DUF177 domain-containing protein [Clostridia bacterium]